jgi:hypothetical protein
MPGNRRNQARRDVTAALDLMQLPPDQAAQVLEAAQGKIAAFVRAAEIEATHRIS